MIISANGDLLAAEADALVNAVNCVGVMGKGIALRFKQAYPVNFQRYAAACKASAVVIGSMFVVEASAATQPHTIINFPTKRHWRDASHLADIQAGLVDLVAVVRRLRLPSIAVPALGCGNGGLDWAEVRPLVEVAFVTLPEIRVLLYAPAAT
jgi:O-acetyl-ADP-ribose deacetylase (regulator of RNase III)